MDNKPIKTLQVSLGLLQFSVWLFYQLYFCLSQIGDNQTFFTLGVTTEILCSVLSTKDQYLVESFN